MFAYHDYSQFLFDPKYLESRDMSTRQKFREKNVIHHQFRTRYGLTGLWGSCDYTAPGSRSLIFSLDQTDRDLSSEHFLAFRFPIFLISIALQPMNRNFGSHAVNIPPSINGVLFRIVPTTQILEMCPEHDLRLSRMPTTDSQKYGV